MPSTMIRRSANAAHVFIDDMPPLADAMRDLVDCRSRELPVPPELLNSVRAYRLQNLAEAIERYNNRLAEQVAVSA